MSTPRRLPVRVTAFEEALASAVRRPPTLDVVLVNWNTGPILRRSLAGLAAAEGDPRVHVEGIWVVDNASSDHSADRTEPRNRNLHIIRNPRNVGFARACNQGACAGRALYILFINPDVCVQADTLAVSIAALHNAAERGFGIAGVSLVDPNGLPMPSIARFPWPRWFLAHSVGLDRVLRRWLPPHFLAEGELAAAEEVDQVIGAYFMVRRDVYELLGGFDEAFFVYFEELDFSLRARQAGIRTLFVGGARAVHYGGVSSDQVIAERTFYSWRSRVLYSYKHFGVHEADAILGTVLVAEPAVRMAVAMATLKFITLWELARGTTMLWRALPELLAARAFARRRAERASA